MTTITCRPASCARRSAAIVRGLQRAVLPDERAVEVGRDDADVARKRLREAAGSAVRVAAGRLDDVGGDVGDLLVGQLALERRHRSGARRSRGRPRARAAASPGRGSGRRCRSSRRPSACGSRVQPALRKTALPATGSPFLYCAGTVAVGSVAARCRSPSSGVGVDDLLARLGRRAARRDQQQRQQDRDRSEAAHEGGVYNGRATLSAPLSARGSVRSPAYNAAHETQILWSRRRADAADAPDDGAARPALRHLRGRALPGPRASASPRCS